MKTANKQIAALLFCIIAMAAVAVLSIGSGKYFLAVFPLVSVFCFSMALKTTIVQKREAMLDARTRRPVNGGF